MKLILVVKKKWFDMIASGEKTEEYREAKPYWTNRLAKLRGLDKEEQKVEFRLGWQKNIKGIEFYLNGYYYAAPRVKRIGNRLLLRPEWGYEPSKPTYVIKFSRSIA